MENVPMNRVGAFTVVSTQCGKSFLFSFYSRTSLSSPSGVGEKPQIGAAVMFDLLQRALSARLVRTPAQERRSVTEAPGGEMVVGDFDHEPGHEWLPLGRALRAPAT